MKLTDRERKILELSQKGLSDYKIARKIRTDPPSVTRSRKNAHKKLFNAMVDLDWAMRLNVRVKVIRDEETSLKGKFLFYL